MAYLILQTYALLIFLIGILVAEKLKSEKHFINYLIVPLLICFSGFRTSVGVDYWTYHNIFNSLLNGEQLATEPATYLIVNLVKLLGGTEQLVFFVYSAVTVVSFGIFIKKYSNNIALSWLIFISFGIFFLGSLNLVRQYAAIGLFAATLVFLLEKKKKSALLFGSIAVMFHYSAIIVLLVLPFLTKRYSILLYCLVLVITIGSLSIFEYLISISKYGIYLQDSHQKVMNNDRNSFLSILFILVGVATLAFKEKIEVSRKSNIIINLCFISMLLIIVSFVSNLPNMFFYRLNNYFMISYLIVITYFLKNLDLRIRFPLILVIALFMYTYNILTIHYKGESLRLTPYLVSFELW